MAPPSRKAACLLLLVALLALLCSAASAQPSVSSGLTTLLAKHKSGQLKSIATTQLTTHILNNFVRFHAATAEGCQTEDLVAELEALGAVQIAHIGLTVSGWLPIPSVEKLKDCKNLQLIRESVLVAHQQSRQACRSLYVPLKLQGSWKRPVKVGMLSDSFDSLGGYALDIESNALPTNVDVLSDFLGQGTLDEGRAMAQLVHSVAPDADLAFYTAYQSEADYANGILALARSGCRVICDDIQYLDEPMFQNGIVAQAVNSVRARGVAYFSASGNNGFKSYRSVFVDSGIQGSHKGTKLHQFGTEPGPTSRPITQQQFRFGLGVTSVVLNWDSPFYSVSGPPGSRTDVDISITLPKNSDLQIFSFGDTRNIGGDAYEILAVYNPTNFPEAASLSIEWVAGDKPGVIKYVVFTSDDRTGPLNFLTNSSTCFGHAATTGSVAVGAANYRDTRAYTGQTSEQESYSSPVGTPLLFTETGMRLPQQQLVKNLIMAVDGIDTTFFPPYPHGSDTNGNLQPEFFGTSAAAPNAAAVAALLFGTSQRGLSADTVVNALFSTTDDMDDPRTPQFDRGWDYATGYGMINATRAAELFNVFACT
eukprot:jgi/Chlat1/6068/Chrsp4S00492